MWLLSLAESDIWKHISVPSPVPLLMKCEGRGTLKSAARTFAIGRKFYKIHASDMCEGIGKLYIITDKWMINKKERKKERNEGRKEGRKERKKDMKEERKEEKKEQERTRN